MTEKNGRDRRSFMYSRTELPAVTESSRYDVSVGGTTYERNGWTLEEARANAVEAIAWYKYLKDLDPAPKTTERVRKRAVEREARAERDAKSLAMLKEGASYTDVAETFGWSRNYLADKFPGYGWTASEGGQLGMAIRHSTGFEDMTRPLRVNK